MQGFPVTVLGQAVPSSIESLKDSLASGEGLQSYYNINTTMTLINASTGNGLQLGTTINAPAGKAIKVNGLYISSSNQIDFFARVNQTALATVIERDFTLTIPANNPTFIPVEWVIRSGFNILLYAKKAYGTTDATIINIYVAGHMVTDDFTQNAKKQMLFIGDSITAGTGATNTWNMYQFMMKNYLRQRGVSAKLTMMGLSGSTTSTHLPFLTQGRYDIGQIDLVCVAIGVNDAKNGVTPATYKANLQLFINWALNHPENPNLNIVLIGASPLQAVAAEAAAVTGRQQITALVSENNNARLFGFDLGGAFADATAYSNYVSSDPNGTAVHPNDASHLLLYNNKVVPYLASANGIRLINALK